MIATMLIKEVKKEKKILCYQNLSTGDVFTFDDMIKSNETPYYLKTTHGFIWLQNPIEECKTLHTGRTVTIFESELIIKSA